jgi:predicted 2-oxoglutarate/Fe(II)-dependent dioxygenase YbiX
VVSILHIKRGIHRCKNVFTKEECKFIIDACENSSTKWTKHEDGGYFTFDKLIENVDDVRDLVKERIHNKIIGNALQLDKNELFIIKYYNKGNSQNHIVGYHQDKAPISFSISLNDNFKGGEIHFLEAEQYIKNPPGDAVLFTRNDTHSNIKVTSGTRYVIYGSTKN